VGAMASPAETTSQPVVIRKSIKRTTESALAKQVSLAKSIDRQQDGSMDYQGVIEEAKRCVGPGAIQGCFHEEWDAQLLVDCGRTSDGHRLVLFCPKFLVPIIDDPDELDRALCYMLLAMDGVAMREKYSFIFCYLGMDWTDPRLTHRFRVAYELLPHKFSKHLRHCYILHSTTGFRVSIWTFWPWLSQRLWHKIEHVHNLDELLHKIHPNNMVARADLRRRVPQIVQRHDAEWNGCEPPVIFGMPLRRLCNDFGIDYMDKTTGRWYMRLPPALIFLCEAIEREGADADFGRMFEVEATAVYDLVEAVDEGRPFERDAPTSALWCVLKLFLDCLPSPLLTFEAMKELERRQIATDDSEAQRVLLVEMFQNRLPSTVAYVALYMASFLHTMCELAEERATISRIRRQQHQAVTGAVPVADEDTLVLTPRLAARVFASNFLRPLDLLEEYRQLIPMAEALVESLVHNALEPELWVGREAPVPPTREDFSSDSDSDDNNNPPTAVISPRVYYTA